MTDTQVNSVQQYVAHADSTVRSVKPSLKSVTQKKVVEETSVSHADSAFFFTSDTSFDQICLRVTDVANVVTPSRWAKDIGCDTLSTSYTQQPSLTTTSELLEPTPRGSSPLRQYSGAVVLTVLLAVISLCVIRATSRTIISDVFGLISDSIGWKRFEQSQFALKGFDLFLFNAVYFVVMSVFATEIVVLLASDLMAGLNVYMLTGAVTLAIFAFYVLRFISDAVIGFAFRVEANLRLLTVYRRSSRAIIGMLLLPIVLLLPFVSASGATYVAGFGLLIIIVITIIRLAKTIRINLANLATFLYFILYLCTVEAMPLACLLKIAQNMSQPAGV